MTLGWVCWSSRSGLTRAHYVGSPGAAPLCGWRGEGAHGISAGRRAEGRIAAPADATPCAACSEMLATRPSAS